MTATTQCYRYPDDDTVPWEYFDYIEGDEIKQFTPNSDWEYLEFRVLIRAEWAKVIIVLAPLLSDRESNITCDDFATSPSSK